MKHTWVPVRTREAVTGRLLHADSVSRQAGALSTIRMCCRKPSSPVSWHKPLDPLMWKRLYWVGMEDEHCFCEKSASAKKASQALANSQNRSSTVPRRRSLEGTARTASRLPVIEPLTCFLGLSSSSFFWGVLCLLHSPP